MNEKLWWYVARSGGLVAWWLLAVAVLWGLLLSTRIARGKPSPAWLLALHRFLGALALAFSAVHMIGLWADSWVKFGPTELFVPLASGWRPVAVAWGIISLYMLVAIEVTSIFMRKIPRRFWRAVHSSSFVLFVMSTVHVFASGTDRNNRAIQWSSLVIGMAFTFLTAYRQFIPKKGSKSRVPAPAAV
jgi:predicted ferric reductase